MRTLQVEKKYVRIILLLVIMCSLVLVPSLRLIHGNPVIIGDEGYYHIRKAAELLEQGIEEIDPLVFAEEKYIFQPYHFILAVFIYFLGSTLTSVIVPFISGVLTLVLFHQLLKRYIKKELERTSIFAVFALSPVFIYTATIISIDGAAIPLTLGAIYFFNKKEGLAFRFSLLLFAFIPFFGLLHALLTLVILYAYVQFDKRNADKFPFVAGLVSLISFLHYIPYYFSYGIPPSIKPITENIVGTFVADLGAMKGVSIFGILLFIIGLMITWNTKKKHYFPYLSVPALLIISIFFNHAVAYANFGLALIAGWGIACLVRMKWDLKQIRSLSLLLLFCGLLFSSLSFSFRLGESAPNNDLYEALAWLKENRDDKNRVFSHFSQGFWIQHIADHPTLLDSAAFQNSQNKKIINDSMTMFHTTDIRITRQVMESYNISYIFISNEMVEGTVWDSKNRGLHFLLQNKETFKKIYGPSDTGIWEYIYKNRDDDD